MKVLTDCIAVLLFEPMRCRHCVALFTQRMSGM
jgi:hypothetical protein